MTPRYVTVSEIEDFLKDEWRWYARWVLNRVPRRWYDALILGTAVHDVLEQHFNGMPLVEAYTTTRATLLHKVPDPDHAMARHYALKGFDEMEPQILAWRDRLPVERTLEVEEPFELEVAPGWILRGRPDRPVIMHGKVYHQQHKTAGKGKPYDILARHFARSLHEGLYGFHLEEKYRDVAPYGGSIINLIRKGKPAKGAGIESMNFQTAVALTDFDLTRARMRLSRIVARMRYAEAVGNAVGIWGLVDVPALDSGPYMNSTDGYLPVLTGRTTLDNDNLFMPREETYGTDR
jgi:hypothetical protein